MRSGTADASQKHEVTEYDVLILGAGPSGAACALALKDSGLRVALLDKSSFPRDKICGDAIPGKAVRALHQLNPDYVTALRKIAGTPPIRRGRVVAHNGVEASVPWVLEAYNSPRLDFDLFLVDLVKKHTTTHFLFDTRIEDVNIVQDGVVLSSKDHSFKGKIVVACDGAHSIIAKKLAGFTLDRNHFCGAVRVYYRNIEGSDPQLNECFFSKKMMPGYFWVFPVADNLYNVGFGMLSKSISKKKVNLEKALFEVIDEFPELRKRFENATLVSKPQGMGLPLGTRRLKLSGDRFLLCGDAASLIDPISGAGIDTAIISGITAAEHIIKHRDHPNFSGAVNLSYDKSVYEKLGKSLKRNTRILRTISRFPFLLQLGLKIISLRNKRRM
jgi:geranylgeranyl reductase family protein